MTASSLEREVIVLRAVTELINSIVNHEVLSIGGDTPDTEVRFPSSTHQKYFNIVLVDFLSRVDESVIPFGGTYMDAILSVCRDPQFAPHCSATELHAAVSNFAAWLGTRIDVKTWMPSIDLEATLSVTRSLLIRIGGNVSKHNVLRLGRTAGDLQKVLAEAGHTVTREASLLALTDVYERFHNNLLNYHSCTITEFLNNIRWGIHEYLEPEFQRSFTSEPPDPIRYHYVVPSSIQSTLATDCYWSAMNDVRAKPYIRRFTATEWLKRQH